MGNACFIKNKNIENVNQNAKVQVITVHYLVRLTTSSGVRQNAVEVSGRFIKFAFKTSLNT